MSNRTRDLFFTAIGAAVGAGAAVWGINALLSRFKDETETAKYKLSHHSQVVETAKGPVEISVHGEGPPVLVVHGAAGGYDQGEVRAEAFSGVQYISVSRPGYLTSTCTFSTKAGTGISTGFWEPMCTRWTVFRGCCSPPGPPMPSG